MSSYFHKFLLRRDTLSELDSANPILASGEPTIALDKNILKIGDGEHRWQDLPSFISSREFKHKSIAISIPSIAINNSHTLYISFEDVDINNKYAVFASPSTDLPTGIVISHCYVSGNNTVAIKFTNTSTSNSSASYDGTINIIVYMTDEAIIPVVITTTPPPVKDSFYSFGYNNFGQLGLSDIQDRARPTYAGLPVSGNPENLWNDISLGYYHTLAISKSGDLFSFGYNYYGQLGNGEFGIGKNVRKPTLINSGINWTKVSAGAYHSLAIGDNKLFAFGSNAHGSLGLGDTNFRSNITGLNTEYVYENLEAQASGKIINSKLLLNYNTGDTYAENKLYTLPVGSSISISLDAGYYVAVLNRNRTNLIAYSGVPNSLLTTSIVKNVSGTKYDGEYTFYNGDVSIAAFGNYDTASLYFYNVATDSFSYYGGEDILRSQDDTGWTHISAGHYHSIAIKNGYLYSWGNNAFGQLGVGDNTDRYEPTLISQDNTWVDVAAGNYHSLAIKNDGGTYKLYTFGKNDHGQLGLNSSLPQVKLPTLVNSSFNEISLYNTETLQSGSLINVENLKYVFNYSNNKTYDVDDKYVLSEGTYIISGVPPAHPIAFLNAGKTDLFTYFGQNNAGTKVIDGNQYTFYHGNITINVYGNFDSISAYGLFYGYMGAKDIFLYDNDNATPANIDAGIDFSIVRTDLDEVWTFGKNNLGQLGLGDYNRRIKPHKIKDYDWTHAKAGANHVLLLDSSKKMWSFGDNTHGQLGLGDNFGRNEPTVVNSLERYDDIIAGGNHSIGAIFSAAPTTPIITNVLTSNDTNDIYDRNLKIVWEDVLSEQYGVTDYIVESGISINGPWTLYGDTLTDDKFVTISGATVGTNYFFRVKSRNEEGFSDYSNIASGIPERLIDDLYCSTMLLLHFDTNFNSLSRFTSTYTGINGPTLNTNNSVFGNSYYDNGSTKQLQYVNNQDFNIPNDLCVEFYFKTSGVTSENIVRSIIQGNNFTTASINNTGDSFAVLSSGQNIIVAEKQNSTIRTLFTYPIPQNRQSDWNHFAWVRDDLTHKLFFNGIQVSGITQTSVLSYTQNTIRIAGNNTNSNSGIYTSFGMKGWIDELRITKQPRYTQSFSSDLFKRPFGEVAAENCGAGFSEIPLEFDSAYSWNFDIGDQKTRAGILIADQNNVSLWNGSGLYNVTTSVVSGDIIGISDYYGNLETSYVEAYLNTSLPNNIVGYSGITITGNGTQLSPARASGDYTNVDKIFKINNSGILFLSTYIKTQTMYGDQLYLIKNGLPNYAQSGVVANFNKYSISGVGSVKDPMHVKIGRNFFFNQPRESSKVWIRINVDGYLDIDASKFNNQEGFWFYKTDEEPSQHFEYFYRKHGSNSWLNSDDYFYSTSYGYIPTVEPCVKTFNSIEYKDYDFGQENAINTPTEISVPDNAHYAGTQEQIHYRYDNIPIKKGDYIVCGLYATGAMPSPPACNNSGEIKLSVRQVNNLLELNFENNLIDKSSFDHRVIRTHNQIYNLEFEKDSIVGNYSLKFPQGLSINPINSTNDYRFPLSVDIPTNYFGIQKKFTIETFFKFDTLVNGQIEFHRLFALERPKISPGWQNSSNSQNIDGQKRDYINLTLQTSGSNVINAQLAFNSEYVKEKENRKVLPPDGEVYDRSSTSLYGFKNGDEDNIIYTLNIPSGSLTNISTSDWNHLALVKYYDMVLLFINGKPISNSIIAKKRLSENYEDIYVFENLTSWNGAYESYDIPVASGDIIGLKSTISSAQTSSVTAYYSDASFNNLTNLIRGNNITITGQGNSNSVATASGNYANVSGIFKCNHTGLVTLRANMISGSSSLPQDLILLKNGISRKAAQIDNTNLELPSRFDVRSGKVFRKLGSPFTIGPIRGNIDLLTISADAKYLTEFDADLLPYRNDEYFSYDGRKYKKRNTFFYNISVLDGSNNPVFGTHEFEGIEPSGRYTSVFLDCSNTVDKIRFSVASYTPKTKIKIRRTNKEKEFHNNNLLTGTIKAINYVGTTPAPCMSTTYSNQSYLVKTESTAWGLHSCVNLDLLNSNINTSGLYYQDFELDVSNSFVSPYNYLHMEIIHDQNDITDVTRPSAPRNLTATSGYNSLTLSWNEPESYGGERLNGYIIDSSISGSFISNYYDVPKTNSFTLTGLIGNSGYLLSLTAANVIGSGDFTSPILVYPKQSRAPFAPQNFNIYSSSGAMVVNWEAPIDNGGSEITSYNIYYTLHGGSENVLSTQNDRVILTPLGNPSRYDVRVAAMNIRGVGDYSPTIISTVVPKRISVCGSNGVGQLGTNNTNNLTIPSGLLGFNDSWIEISMGRRNACAINTSGELYTWGENNQGQIGDGTSTPRYVPTKTLGPVNNVNLKWKKCSIYEETLYAISDSGYLYGAGTGSNGELGTGPISVYPRKTSRLIPLGYNVTLNKNNWKDVKAGPRNVILLDENGDIYITGTIAPSTTSVPTYYEPTKISIFDDISQSGYLTFKKIFNAPAFYSSIFLAIDKYDRLITFTFNIYSQAIIHSPVSGVNNCIAAAGRFDDNFGILIAAVNSSGELYVCGNNGSLGIIGNGITTTAGRAFSPYGIGGNFGQTVTPIAIKTSGTQNNFIDVSATFRGIMALNSSGEIWCIGQNNGGVFGIGNNNIDLANTSFIKSSGDLFYDKISTSATSVYPISWGNSSSLIALGYDRNEILSIPTTTPAPTTTTTTTTTTSPP